MSLGRNANEFAELTAGRLRQLADRQVVTCLFSLKLTGDRLNREQHSLKFPHSAVGHRLCHLSLSLVSLVLVLLVTIVRAEHRRRHPAARSIFIPPILRAILPRFLSEEILDDRTLHLPLGDSRDLRDPHVGILRAPPLSFDDPNRSCRVMFGP